MKSSKNNNNNNKNNNNRLLTINISSDSALYQVVLNRGEQGGITYKVTLFSRIISTMDTVQEKSSISIKVISKGIKRYYNLSETVPNKRGETDSSLIRANYNNKQAINNNYNH